MFFVSLSVYACRFPVIASILMLLHSLKTFPAHVPSSVFRETGVEHIAATVPTGTHHGYSVQQTAVARQIEAQTLGLWKLCPLTR